MGLPVAAGGRPPANASGSMGLPVGMSIGQASGSYGGVAGTHPGITAQNQISARAQTAFNVQPEVTVAYRTQAPLPSNARRKDFLFTVHPEVHYKDGTNRSVEKYYTSRDFEIDGGKSLKYGRSPSGVTITTAAEFNTQMAAAVNTNLGDQPLSKILKPTERNTWAQNTDTVVNIIRPLGVYHNRATHDAHTAYAHVGNSNVSEIISVSKSNHCFMRDIWGIDIFPGDQLGFLYANQSHPHFVEIIPFVGHYPTMTPQEINRLANTQEYAHKFIQADLNSNTPKIKYVPIGKLWAAPMHSPFNPNGRSNIVGAGTAKEDYASDLSTINSYKMHSIEVELTPYMGSDDF